MQCLISILLCCMVACSTYCALLRYVCTAIRDCACCRRYCPSPTHSLFRIEPTYITIGLRLWAPPSCPWPFNVNVHGPELYLPNCDCIENTSYRPPHVDIMKLTLGSVQPERIVSTCIRCQSFVKTIKLLHNMTPV